MDPSQRIKTAIPLLLCAIGTLTASAQLNDGVITWGGNGVGGAPVFPDATNVIIIAAKTNLTALRADGTVVGVAGSTNFTAIANGWSHNLGVSNGMVFAWTDPSQLTIQSGLSNAVAVAVGWGNSLALNSEGTVTAWGVNDRGQLSVPAGLSNVVAITCGYYDDLALKNDGTLVGWGDNEWGQISVPSAASNIVAVSGGYLHTLALRSDGTVLAWGYNNSGQCNVPVGLSNVVSIAAGAFYSMALKNDGSLVIWGDNTYGQTNPPPGLTNIIEIAGAQTYAGALTNNNGSPWITLQPASHTAYPGATAVFTAFAAGPQPLTYQWQSNGVPVAGATNTILSLSNIQYSGLYSIIVSNSFGFIASSNAMLNVITPPVLTIQPLNSTLIGGSNVTFTSSISSSYTFVYQWQFNGTNLPGATNSTLSLSNLLDSQSGAYNLVASNSLGSITSPPASLTVIPWVIPHISPTTATVGSGIFVQFTLSEAGFSPTGTIYQWRLNSNVLGGLWTWSSSAAGSDVSPLMQDAGAYDIVATDSYTSVTSSVANLTLIPLTITNQPTNTAAWPGRTVKFTISAVGQKPLSYQWQFNGADIPGANTNSLVITNVQPDDLGSYDVVVTNAFTNIVSSTATLAPSEVIVWGGGNGETNIPPGLTNIVAIAGGMSSGTGLPNSLALGSDGVALQWPPVFRTNVNVGSNVIAVSGSGPGFGLHIDGTVSLLGPEGSSLVSNLSNTVAIAAYNYNYLALNADGLLTEAGGLPPIPAEISNVVAVGIGSGHYVVLRSDGTVVAWGNNNYGQTNVPPGLSNVVAIAAGMNHSMALTAQGTVVAWGRNLENQTNVPVNLSNVVAIAAGAFHSLALKADGTITAWGLNQVGQTNVPVPATNIVAIAAGMYHSMALLGDGPPSNQAFASAAVTDSNSVAISIPTESGRVFALQYKTNLTDTNWIALPLAAGTGTNRTLTDTNATDPQRFYRILRW